MPVDAVIVGSGPGGATAADVLTAAGWSVAIMEKGRNHLLDPADPTRPVGDYSNDEIKFLHRSFLGPDPLLEPRTFRTASGDGVGPRLEAVLREMGAQWTTVATSPATGREAATSAAPDSKHVLGTTRMGHDPASALRRGSLEPRRGAARWGSDAGRSATGRNSGKKTSSCCSKSTSTARPQATRSNETSMRLVVSRMSGCSSMATSPTRYGSLPGIHGCMLQVNETTVPRPLTASGAT